LAEARQDRLYAVWAVALAAGLRKGEALALRWQDVDLEAGTLRVSQTVQRVAGKLVFSEPKTARSRRTVPLSPVAVTALRAHRAMQATERLRAGTLWHDSGLVFTTTVGTALDPRHLNRLFDDLCRRANIRRVRVHDLRHTCASLLLAQGVEPKVIMETLGHSQISTTMDLYAHVLPALQRQAATRMDDLLSGGG
jgi:integrase